MKTVVRSVLGAICTPLFLVGAAAAGVTVSAVPNPAVVGEQVKITAGATFSPKGTSCGITVNYGDGSPSQSKACAGSPCTLLFQHAYTHAAGYTAQTAGYCGNDMEYVYSPKTASIAVLVKASPSSPLPAAPAAGGFSLIAVPTSIALPRGQTSVRQVTYLVSGAPAGAVSATSPRGEFRVGGEIVGDDKRPLTVALASGAGSGSETVTVPVRVVDLALQRGSTRIEYVRPFSAGSVKAEARVSIVLTTAGAADFQIRRVELSFENGQAEAIVARNAVVPRALADISYRGSGWLEGYWEADGAVVANVRRFLGPEGRVRLQTPDAPAPQTFNTGAHVVSFVVASPPPSFPLPSIVYVVPPGEGLGKPFGIDLVAPEDSALFDPAPLRLTWDGSGAATLFLVQFSSEEDGPPLFSAFTRESSYLLSTLIFGEVFSPGGRYFWKVTGYDAEGRVRSESQVRTFAFRR